MSILITPEIREVSREVGSLIESGADPGSPKGHALAHMVMANDSQAMSRTLVGKVDMPQDRQKAILINAFEKNNRVMGLWSKDPMNVVSSAQSANPDKGFYGGGVVFPRTEEFTEALAISGYSELEDEAGVLIIGLENRLCSETYAARVVAASQNTVFRQLYDSYRAAFGSRL